MARTNKDRPYLVKVRDKNGNSDILTEVHNHNRFGMIHIRSDGSIRRYDDVCTIDDIPGQKDSKLIAPCFRYISVYKERGHYKEARLDTYYRPLRRMERDELTKAAKEYNTYGEVEDTIAFQDNHQHSMLGGGYW